MNLLVLIPFLLFPFFCWPVALFTPPSDWKAAKPKEVSGNGEIGFVKKGSSDFISSIMLSTEEVDCNLREYVQAVKEIHLSQSGTTWHDLKSLEMKAGKGHLIEISNPSPWGELALLQAFFIKGSTAYILTAAALKRDLPPLQKEILAAFKSFRLEPDLWSGIEEPLHSTIKGLFASLGTSGDTEEKKKQEWENLQKVIEKETSTLGSYWQFLALREGRAKIYGTSRSIQ